MTEEKKVMEQNAPQQKSRFEFVLSVNGNIICQRSFGIYNFKWKSYGSKQFTRTFRGCVEDIKNDLRAKSNLYNIYTAPQVLNTMEEFAEWQKSPARKEENNYKFRHISYDVPKFVVIRDTRDVYVWDGEKAEKYEGYFNVSEYIDPVEAVSDMPCLFKFAFLDSGREIMSEIWDGNVYHKFVRSNIDLTNSRNKFASEEKFSPFEFILTNIFKASQEDLTVKFINAFREVCSFEDKSEYETVMDYGTAKYRVDWRDYCTRKYEKLYFNKTKRYMESIGVSN